MKFDINKFVLKMTDDLLHMGATSTHHVKDDSV